jgi:hypothetical protein
LKKYEWQASYRPQALFANKWAERIQLNSTKRLIANDAKQSWNKDNMDVTFQFFLLYWEYNYPGQ